MNQRGRVSVCFGTAQDAVVLANAKLQRFLLDAEDEFSSAAAPSGAAGVENQLSILIVQPH
jgi:hypothetical protein